MHYKWKIQWGNRMHLESSKENLKEFKKNHITEGTIIDIKITFTDAKEIETNIKVTQDDLNIIEELKKIKG